MIFQDLFILQKFDLTFDFIWLLYHHTNDIPYYHNLKVSDYSDKTKRFRDCKGSLSLFILFEFLFIMSSRKLSYDWEMINDWYSHAEASVYGRLRWWWRSTGRADVLYPSIEQIANDVKRTPKQVQRSIKVLEERGLIEVSRRWYKRRNNYYICDKRKYPPEVNYNGD